MAIDRHEQSIHITRTAVLCQTQPVANAKTSVEPQLVAHLAATNQLVDWFVHKWSESL